MTYTTTGYTEFLSISPPFNQLERTAIEELAGLLQPLRYRLGQVIYRRGKMSPNISILYEGRARMIGYDPRTQMPVNLKLLEPGAIMGWVNLSRGIACETAIASTEVICLTLKNQDFLNFLNKNGQMQSDLRYQCSLVEIFDLLGHQLEQQAVGYGNIKELAVKAQEIGEVYNVLPNCIPTIESNKVWFLSGGELGNVSIGDRLTREEVAGAKGARLLGFAVEEWDRLEGSTVREILPTEGDEREAGEEDSLRDAIPQAPTNLEEEERAEPEGESIEQKYPFYPGETPLDAGVAIFRMLSKYFGMPFRKDSIRRIVEEQIERHETLSLNTCGAVTELMGLNAQLLTIPAESFTKIEAPLMVRWEERLAIVYEISDRSLVIGIPELGIIKREPAAFLETWGESAQVLLLKKTKETPQAKFGLSWFLPYIIRYRRVLIEVFIASFFVQLFALAYPLMMRVILDKVIGQDSVTTLNALAIFLIVIGVFEAILSTLRTYLFVDTTNRIDLSLGSQIIDHLLRLPLRYFEKRPVGEISTRINELENIRQFLTGTALTVVLDAVFSVIYIVVMLSFSPLLTAVTLSVIPVFILLTVIFSPIIRRQIREKAERNAATQSYLVEVMTGIQTVKAQNIELIARWEWQERYARYVDTGFKTVITSTLAGSISKFLNEVSGLLIIWVGVFLTLEGKITLGSLIAFRILGGYVTSPILRLTQLWQNFQETALSLERLSDIVDTPEEGEEDRNNIPMPAISGEVKYENVTFRFKQNGPLQLYNVSVEISAGTFVGIVGESGAGKSTLTKLLSRLYEPESGQILIDGYDINKVELYSLRRQIGVVPQETLLFDGSIQENIAITNPDATTEEIVEAAKIAAAHEFIMTLPNGYNTKVGERGSSLSGGQRQRIAIARSVLQKPRMLVLDEATSALDYATEQKVCLNLIEAFRDKTVFFITHRLSTIKNSDVIIMMDSGTIVEMGSHQELMAMKGQYYYLYQQQDAGV
ncbi:MAG: peptidase domain-containing ABC transporter [Gomphosphaeria aponina SAG 52.96 = DSM 107014]|uniref:Peptidase domain-containing ABC transporter n=1 Tax=Gomphosphaeria aponina SAG 52.96 = DSM 107014 TaxID=1521640 RepID=A0A941JVM8_9CHRO|nr:peptidase domain-containing ABC transporter [Gomphosphaeria aponina SAG 52.96 = DSM 107014]